MDTGSTYDPMLSKVIAYGPDRAAALRVLRGALADTVILGVQTNTGFLRRLLAHPDVVSGDLDTGLVERDLAGMLPEGVPPEVYATAALLAQDGAAAAADGWVDPFGAASGWRLGGTPAWTVHHFRLPGQDPVTVRTRPSGTETELLLTDTGDDPAPSAIEAQGPGQSPGAPARGRIVARTAEYLTVELGGVTHRFSQAASPEGTWLGRDGDSWHVQDHDPVTAALSGAATPAPIPSPPPCPAPSPWSRSPSATASSPGRACSSSRR